MNRGPLTLALAAALLTGCQPTRVELRADPDFRIVAPTPRASVTPPVRLRWAPPSPDLPATAYGVFVDLAPQPPGRTLEHFSRRFPLCFEPRRDDRCLADHGIHVVRRTSVELPGVARREAAPRGYEDVHEASVVPLDGHTRRLGERVAHVQFTLRWAP